MELRNLKAFCMVARSGSQLRASRDLGLTPAAVSMRLKHLEAEIDVKLFERKPNRLTLTDDGKFLLERVQRVVESIDESVASLHSRKGIIAGSVSVVMGGDIANSLTSKIVAFVKECPEVKLRTLTMPSAMTFEMVLKDQVEMGIGRFGDLPGNIQKIHLFTSGLVAIYRRRHPLVTGKRVSLAALASQGLVVLPSGSATRRLIDDVFLKKGLSMKTIVEAGSCLAIKRYVRLGLGVGIIHEQCLLGEKERQLSASDLAHILQPQEVSLIYKKNRQLTPAQQRFIEVLSHGDISPRQVSSSNKRFADSGNDTRNAKSPEI